MTDSEKPAKRGLDVLEAFPDLKLLGIDALQELSNSWLKTATAREFAVTEVLLVDDAEKLLLSFRVDLNHDVRDHECYHFPMDDLLLYLANHGLDPVETRDRVRREIATKRQQAGPDVYQTFRANLGPELPCT